MEEAFGIVLFVVVGVAIVVAVWALATSSGSYSQIGSGGISMGGRRPVPLPIPRRCARTRSVRCSRPATPAASPGERTRSTSTPSCAPWTAPAVDPELREEVRTLVEARNARRVARGEEPLDVEAETDRQLRELGGAG